MGVGDRHSKRSDKPRAEVPASRAAPPAVPVDDRDLDDAFSAWDDDDAGAHQPSPVPQPAAAAKTRNERKAAATPDPPPDEPLVDPVAMRDIVISRARTLHDPLTTGVLAEIARKKTSSDAAIVLPAAPEAADAPSAAPEAEPGEPTRSERATEKIGPAKLSAEARSGTRTATKAPDPPAEQAPSPASLETSDARITRQEIPSPRRRSRH